MASFLIMHPFYNVSEEGRVWHFMRTIKTIVCVPLFCDWEEMYRKYQGTRTVAHCWRESKKMFAKFLALYLFEHALALIPMIWLKLAVDRRNAKLEEVFDLLSDERRSTFMTNLLVTLGVV